MVAEGHGVQPFFSIGVPTYNRHKLLRETLQSVLSQSFGDFEIIVGNDYQAEVLTGEMLGITDPRIRFMNHPRNLRETGNMNALLHLATGRYFTWLFDDDLHEPDYLLTAYQFLAHNNLPPALFSSFKLLRGNDPFLPRKVTTYKSCLLTGQEFLTKYFAGRVKIVSTSGLFETVKLREIVGGVEELCPSAIGLYSEYLFLAKCALLDRIAYLDSPFVVMRFHSESWSQTNLELHKYLHAGQTLVQRCSQIFRYPSLSGNLGSNLLGICKIHLYTYAYKSARFEMDQSGLGVRGAYRAIALYYEAAMATKGSFTIETGLSAAPPVFIMTQVRHTFLIIAWFAVFRVRRLFPGFLRLTRSFTPQ